jgi:hypothetical protein
LTRLDQVEVDRQGIDVVVEWATTLTMDWPVTAVINARWFRGALVVLAERFRDPAGPPLQGDTFLDGLTADECDDEATRWISGPPGRHLNWPTPRNRVRF